MNQTIDNFVVKLGFIFDQNKLKKVTDTIEDWQQNLKGLVQTGGFIYFINKIGDVTQKLIDATRATADWATQLERTSRSAGVDSNVLERLRILEKENNLSEGILENTIEAINQKQIRARTGQGYDEGFLRAGIGLGGTSTQVLERIIEAGAKGSERYRKYLSDLLGVDQSIFELYGQDISKIDSYLTTMKRDRKELEETNKLFGKIDTRVEALKKKLIILLLPVVQKILKFANEYLEKILKKVEEIQNDEEKMKKINSWLSKTVTILVLIGSLLIPAIIQSLLFISQFLLSGIFGPIQKIFGLVKTLFVFINTKTALLTGKRLTVWIVDYIKNTKIAIAVTKAWHAATALMGTGLKNLAKVLTPLIAKVWAFLAPILIIIAKVVLITGAILTLSVIIGDLISVFTGGQATISRFLEDTIGKKFPTIGKWIKWLRENIEGAPQSLKDVWEAIKTIAGGLWDWIWEKTKNLFSRLWKGTKSLIRDIVLYVMQQIEDLVASIPLMGKWIKDKQFDSMKSKLELEKQTEKMQAAQEELTKRQAEALMKWVVPVLEKKGIIKDSESKGGVNNTTVHNTNNFQIGEDKDKMEIAQAIGNFLTGATFKNGMDRASIQMGNYK